MADLKHEKSMKVTPKDGLHLPTEEQRKKLEELLGKGEYFIQKAETPPFMKDTNRNEKSKK